MWKCKNCGEEIEDTFDACWNCGTNKDGTPTKNEDVFEEDEDYEELINEKKSKRKLSSTEKRMCKRYKDAYFTSKTGVLIGSVVKTIGWIVGFLIIMLGIVSLASGTNEILGGTIILIGVVFGVSLYVMGIIVCTVSQNLMANLDQAVNTSPFLSKDQIKKVMKL